MSRICLGSWRASLAPWSGVYSHVFSSFGGKSMPRFAVPFGIGSVPAGRRTATAAAALLAALSLATATFSAPTPAGAAPVELSGHTSVPVRPGAIEKGASDRSAILGRPRVTSVVASQGRTTGGNRVTITGSRFVHVRWVKFGGVRATGLRVKSRHKLSVRVPAHAVGTVYVQVRTSAGKSRKRVTYRYVPVAPKPEPARAVRFTVSGLVDQTMVFGSSGGFPSQVFTVEALDQYGNLATGYTGTVRFDGGDFNWPATPGVSATTLPSDSTLTGGRGVFAMNVGNLQEDCHYGDILSPECKDHMRVTATDVANPAITGYQRFRTAVVVRTSNIFYTPDSGVCSDCVVEPTSNMQIDTSQPVLATVFEVSPSSVKYILSGVTVQGGGFSQTIVTDPLVGLSPGSLETTLVTPVVNQKIQVNLAASGSPYGDMEFGVTTVIDPYTGGTTTVAQGVAYTDTIYVPLCVAFGKYPPGCV